MANVQATATSKTGFVSFVNGNAIPSKYAYGLRTKRHLTDEVKIVDICPTTITQPFTVILNEPLDANEFVGLTGDSNALGEWQLDRSITLQSNDTNNMIWTANVITKNCTNSTYRYFTYAEDVNGHKQIRRWETHQKPRSLNFQMNCDRIDTDVFGVNDAGDKQWSRGWLTHDAIIQFKFERNNMFQVLDMEKFNTNDIYIRLMPFNPEMSEGTNVGVKIEVAKMDYGNSQLRKPHSNGILYKTGDIIIYHITVPIVQNELTFILSFYTIDGNALGKTLIRNSMLNRSAGELELNIVEPSLIFGDDHVQNESSVIAHLKLPYLVVKPFNNKNIKMFDFSFVNNWSKDWPNLDVGHRGNGKSYILNPPKENENTIASFLKAYESFADMIELDVHLTADGIPVIYHDFGVLTVPHNDTVSDANELVYKLIKDLNYDELKKLRIFALVDNRIKEYPSHNSELIKENRIFPRLLDVLETLPVTLGIDVEIKWPQLKLNGDVEAEQTIDKNYFIDTVIETVIKYGCGRPLIFSSFDADICTMLRFKQNIFPVMFLSMGKTKKWQPFLDLRTRTFEQAINNAQAFELAGTAPHAEDFLNGNGIEMMKLARNLGQITLVWGDDCNSKEAIKYFRDIGATATCYDRADLYVPENKTSAFFNSTDILSEFKKQCHL